MPYSILYIFLGLIVWGIGVEIARRIVTRPRDLPAPAPAAQLPAPSTAPAMPNPTPAPQLPAPATTPVPPRPRSIYELAGILVVKRDDRMGERIYVEKDGLEYDIDPRFEISPDLLGCFILMHDADQAPRCRYCYGRFVEIDQIARRRPPEGAKDAHILERRSIGRYCSDCGLQVSGGQHNPSWPERPEPFRSTNDLHSVLRSLAYDAGRLTKEIRWEMLSEQYARLQPLTAAIAAEMNRLHAEIWPRTDADPYRGTPLAKLDDPPDDRAKAIPALTDR